MPRPRGRGEAMIRTSRSIAHFRVHAAETGAGTGGSVLAGRPSQMNPTSIRNLLLRLGLCTGIGTAMPSCGGDLGSPNQGTGGSIGNAGSPGNSVGGVGGPGGGGGSAGTGDVGGAFGRGGSIGN